jgi:predicted dithiol-disulfide oxidoreductase (DUF899 family)
MAIIYPGESAEYRAARDRLLEREIHLRRELEEVAEQRRALPPGGPIPEDYVFRGAEGEVRFSELFAPGLNSLALYSFMFPRDPADDRPGDPDGACPSCVALLDQLDGTALHVAPKLNFAVVAKAPAERVLAFSKERGWRHLRLLSSHGTTYNRDYHAETAEGHQRPILNVFHRDSEMIRHFWGSELFYAPMDPGQDPRHVGTLEPSWNMFDLTLEGRDPDWDEQLRYD